ncbi:MAG TPA: HAD family hydrolase [Firmicutes bacterium]|nr:HAD family hydrolase [Bacillota bacterium]
MPKAIFFDLGSTLWDDYPTELYQWEYLTERLRPHGVSITLDQIVEEARKVVGTYCPSLTRSIVFKLLNENLQHYWEVIEDLMKHTADAFSDPEVFRRLNPLYPGVRELLADLSRRYRLAVVSQHVSTAERYMSYHGIDSYFQHITISDNEKLYKPDPRLFALTCQAVGVVPGEVVMVGDRLDNDIWPANRLKMTTVWVLSEPYRRQRPRYHTDVPDYTIENVLELPAVLEQIEGDQ